MAASLGLTRSVAIAATTFIKSGEKGVARRAPSWHIACNHFVRASGPAGRGRPMTIEPLDPQHLEARLRDLARQLAPDLDVDGPELRHLVRVLTGCSLLLTDVYSDERIVRSMERERSVLGLVGQILDAKLSDGGEALYKIRRLRDDVRMVGYKARFYFGLRGLRKIKGYELEELAARAYLSASQALAFLAEDRR